MNDLRFAIRQLRRVPGLSVAAIVTLALGIGATTALFTVVHGVLLEPLPYPDPDRLVLLYAANPEGGANRVRLSVPDFRDWTERSRAVPRMGLYTTLASNLVLQREPEAREIQTAHVSWGFFPTLGVEPLLGRVFREEDETGDPRVVVVSHDFWRRQLGADSAAVGRTVTLSDRAFRVIGVMPPRFAFPESNIAAWALLATVPETSIPFQLRFVRLLNAIGRLAPDASVAQARADLSAIAAGLAAEHPDANAGLVAAAVLPLREAFVGGVRRALLVLLGAVAFVLVIACVNVALLLLARGMARAREIAIRAAVGAGRQRIIRMLLTESLVLAALGGTAGYLLAVWGVEALVAPSGGILPRAHEIAPDATVLAFTLAVSLVTVLAAGLLPALAVARPDPAEQLKRAAPAQGRFPLRGRGGLVAAEVAIALVLLVGAGLLIRSVWTLQNVDPGFRPDGVLAVAMVIPQSRYPERPEYLGAHRQLLERFRGLPGVEAAGSIRHAPLRGAGERISWEVPEHPAPSPAERPTADILQVTPDALRALGVPLLRGRAITAEDTPDAARVIVVNETFAREAFRGEDALGRTVTLGDLAVTVVGVVGDVHHRGLDVPPAPTMYVPIEQISRRAMTFVLRTARNPLALAGAVQEAVRLTDPAQAITEIAPLTDIVHRSVGRPRFFAALLASFAALALVLATVGIYGVLAFSIRQRTREVGIRAALGADRRRILQLVLGQGMRPVAIGLAAGLLGALALTRVLADLLFTIEPIDVPTYVAVTAMLGAVAFAACWIPARRATRVDPMEALRHE